MSNAGIYEALTDAVLLVAFLLATAAILVGIGMLIGVSLPVILVVSGVIIAVIAIGLAA